MIVSDAFHASWASGLQCGKPLRTKYGRLLPLFAGGTRTEPSITVLNVSNAGKFHRSKQYRSFLWLWIFLEDLASLTMWPWVPRVHLLIDSVCTAIGSIKFQEDRSSL
ncbi:hypothetical protein BDV24DRAFT_127792 [Aspergillus arachidicola]|uniref:Uncharacterized protein n=1 Tax=Aspergillus arachidicola TaxID=656916 RepID=A0A5N6YEN2_9EURO|nr:hypothetical protein BDV24DRAFT_127792 [Aspergillus arachidicola]